MAAIEKKLQEMGIPLGELEQPVANYLYAKAFGDHLLYCSGSGPEKNGVPLYVGQVGKEVTLEQGYQCARQAAVNLLSVLKHELGDLDRVVNVIKLLGFINSAPGFQDQPKVMNGASDLMVEVFGEAGRHARAAIGTSALPHSIPVEIEMLVEYRD